MMVLGQYREELDGTLWYCVSRRQYWLIFGGPVPKWGSTGWCLVVLVGAWW